MLLDFFHPISVKIVNLITLNKLMDLRHKHCKFSLIIRLEVCSNNSSTNQTWLIFVSALLVVVISVQINWFLFGTDWQHISVYCCPRESRCSILPDMRQTPLIYSNQTELLERSENLSPPESVLHFRHLTEQTIRPEHTYRNERL